MTALLSDIFQVRQDTTLFRDNGEAYNHVCKKVQEFSSLEDNWDSYDGLAPTKAALLGAQQVAVVDTDSTGVVLVPGGCRGVVGVVVLVQVGRLRGRPWRR